MQSLASVLFKDYRRRVLSLLLLHPEKEYHVREIARLTATVAGTLHKELKLLADVGVLSKRKQGNQVLYRADDNCPIYEELRGILRKTSGIVDVLAEALATIADDISVAFVFGSIAKGKESENSDIDVMVIGEVSFFDIIQALHPSQKILGREINPKVFSQIEWQREFENQGEFLKDVMEHPKLFVIGDHDDLNKFSR